MSEIRMDLVTKVDNSIEEVRKLVEQLTDEEKRYLERNSVIYRHLVNVIRRWMVGGEKE